MRNSMLIVALLVLVELNGQEVRHTPGGLENTFLTSIKQGRFGLLEKHFPTVAFYKSLSKEISGRSDKEIGLLLARSKARLKENWQQILQRTRKNGVDFSAVVIRETLVYDIAPGKPVQGMVVVYAYKGRVYDDFSLIVNQQPGKTWLLEIPNASGVFKMEDTTLRNSHQARQALALSDPALGRKLESQVRAMIGQAKGDSLLAFGSNVLFHGEPATGNWKSAVNLEIPGETQQAERLMNQVKRAMADCSNFKMDAIQVEKESEGYWLVQPVICGRKKVFFAFLSTGNQLLLGDISAE